MYVLVHVCAFNKDIFIGFIKCKNFVFLLIFSILADSRNQLCLWAVSGYIYTEQASMDMDISMDIHAKSVDMDMDMDGKFHIHGNPG